MSKFGRFVKNYTPLGWWYQAASKAFGKSKGISDIVSDLDIGKVIDNLVKNYAGTGMTDKAKEEVDYQTEAQYDLWNRTQSLPAQMSQAKEAGINPMVIFGNGGSPGAVSSVGAPSGAQADFSALIGTLLNFGLRQKEVAADMEVKEATAEGMRIENRWKERNNQANYFKTLAETENIRQNTAKLFHDTEFARIYAQFAPQLFDLQLREGNQNISESQSRVELNEAQQAELYEKLRVHQAEARHLDALCTKITYECQLLAVQKELSEQHISESKARISKLEEEVKLIGKQIGLTDKDIES